jgi:hypothetical protein
MVPADVGSQATAFIKSVSSYMRQFRKMTHMTAPGKTGTSYDYPPWTDWCDHGELLKYVDAMKLMTYTESGTFSLPAPHAPQWFWDSVYRYMIYNTHYLFRKKILCGANMFGTVWDKDGNGDYTSFWDALAAGYMRGALITVEDAEAYWNAYGYTGWSGCGTTQMRAVKESLKRRFHGVGIWKADDGDVTNFFPEHPQLGRDKIKK